MVEKCGDFFDENRVCRKNKKALPGPRRFVVMAGSKQGSTIRRGCEFLGRRSSGLIGVALQM
jgi:hypothetical protein